MPRPKAVTNPEVLKDLEVELLVCENCGNVGKQPYGGTYRAQCNGGREHHHPVQRMKPYRFRLEGAVA